MRKHGGTPSWRDKHVTPAAISPPGVARGRFVGGQQSGLAGCKPPPLFPHGASSCSSQGRCQGEPRGASPRPSAPNYLPSPGLVPPLPLLIFHSGMQAGGCGFRPCRVVASWCPPLPVLVLGLLFSVPPSPLAWAAPIAFCCFFWLSVGCRQFRQGGPPVCFWGAPWVAPNGAVWLGWYARLL